MVGRGFEIQGTGTPQPDGTRILKYGGVLPMVIKSNQPPRNPRTRMARWEKGPFVSADGDVTWTACFETSSGEEHRRSIWGLWAMYRNGMGRSWVRPLWWLVSAWFVAISGWVGCPGGPGRYRWHRRLGGYFRRYAGLASCLSSEARLETAPRTDVFVSRA